MSKEATSTIQNNLVELGKKLGFTAASEEQVYQRSAYAPVYDVDCYLDQHFDLSGLEKLFINEL